MTVRNLPHEYDFNVVKRFTPSPDEVFVDIGSNRGEAILSMLLMSKEKVEIVGFEPNPLVYEKLQKKYAQQNNVVAHNCGLADKKTELELYVPFYRKWMFDGLASFDRDEAKDWLKTRLWRYDEKKLSLKKIKCSLQRLDDFKLKPYFIKIDVQGYEMQVLKGGEETLKTFQPILLVEAIKNEHMEFLRQFDYDFFSYTNGRLEEGIGGLNTFCLNKEKHSKILG